MLTESQKDLVRSLYLDGWNPEDIAEEYDLDECDVMDFCCEIL